MYPRGQRDKQPHQNFQTGLRFERLNDAIVRYLRELVSAEGSVADARDRKK